MIQCIRGDLPKVLYCTTNEVVLQGAFSENVLKLREEIKRLLESEQNDGSIRLSLNRTRELVPAAFKVNGKPLWDQN